MKKVKVVAKQDLIGVSDKDGLLALDAYYEEIVECEEYDRFSIADKFRDEHPEYKEWLITISEIM